MCVCVCVCVCEREFEIERETERVVIWSEEIVRLEENTPWSARHWSQARL